MSNFRNRSRDFYSTVLSPLHKSEFVVGSADQIIFFYFETYLLKVLRRGNQVYYASQESEVDYIHFFRFFYLFNRQERVSWNLWVWVQPSGVKFVLIEIELMINKLHGLSPSGGLVSSSGGFASLLFDQVRHFASIKLCLALSHQGAIIKIPVVRCHYLWCLGAQWYQL